MLGVESGHLVRLFQALLLSAAGGWPRMLQRTTVAGCRCTREERTKAEDEQCRRWVVDFLRSTYNEATAEETGEREEHGQASS